ncbi:MAG TPA: DUF4326 domain-containing protein [Candidatus Hodarchaeales archaeon]|nr:DUF4326 domain-containing protein [Candidatus Hodarchaeales archaeon]
MDRYGLDQLIEFSPEDIQQILTCFQQPSASDQLQDHLAAINLLKSAQLIPDDDRPYVESSYFPTLLGMDQAQLEAYLLSYGYLLPTSTRSELIRTILEEIPETKVVCVRVDQIRPRYHNLEEWAQDPRNVYIGRKDRFGRYPSKDSLWANRFMISRGKSRDEAMAQYRADILQKLRSGEIPRSELERLRGKNLGCWCHPEPCHGNVLVEILNHPEWLD